MPRETESKLHRVNTNPNSSGSRNWSKEEFEQSVDLRVAGILNDETYNDEQYMHKIAEQVRKRVTTERSIKDDSPKDNIQSEQAAKEIYEAGNCELHEIQQRTNEVQCQRCYSYIEAGFQICPCRGKVNMSEEMLSSTRQKFMQLIADAYMPFQMARGAEHGVQPWQKHHFLAKEFMRKINKKGTYSSILDRFQNDEVFHASQLQHNWTKEWCEYLDYIRTIFCTKQLQNNWNDTPHFLYHFRYHPQQMETRPMKSRPDYHETTRAFVNMNKEAGQNTKSVGRNNYREDLDTEKFDWVIWLSQNWKRYFAVNRLSD